jgi:hypothetical protein
MRKVMLISFSVVLPATVPADELTSTGEFPSPPPAYNMLRFDENYSCLANPANRTDWFDPVKYIPLGTNNPERYLTFGGELRERFEGNYDPNFGIGMLREPIPICCSASRCWLICTSVSACAFTRKAFPVCMEGDSQPAPPVQQDPIDLQFAFLDLLPYLTEDESLTLRARVGLG